MKNINRSLIQLTGLMNSDKKFAFINISKSSIIGLNKKNEKTFPSNVSKEIIKTAEASYKHGEIDFFQYLQSIETAKEIELDYLENLNNYNKTIIAINYLTL